MPIPHKEKVIWLTGYNRSQQAQGLGPEVLGLVHNDRRIRLWLVLEEGRVGKRLAILASDFDTRTYGKSKLADLVKSAGDFEVRRTDGGEVFIRVKPGNAKPASRRPAVS